MLSRNGNINDDTIPDHVENENFDDGLISECDGPAGCVNSSSEEKLEKLRESEDDIVWLGTLAAHRFEPGGAIVLIKGRSTATITKTC